MDQSPSTKKQPASPQNAVDSTALETFTIFPKLPAEIRRKIWKTASYHPRVLELHRGLNTFGRLPNGTRYFHEESFRIARSCRSPPPLLSVSHEARHETLKAYKKVQLNHNQDRATSLVHPESNTSTFGPTWFNKDADILYLGKGSCLGTLIVLLKSEVRPTRVAIHIEDHEIKDWHRLSAIGRICRALLMVLIMVWMCLYTRERIVLRGL